MDQGRGTICGQDGASCGERDACLERERERENACLPMGDICGHLYGKDGRREEGKEKREAPPRQSTCVNVCVLPLPSLSSFFSSVFPLSSPFYTPS